jgi:nucleotide-binding universal stress UspA family protein
MYTCFLHWQLGSLKNNVEFDWEAAEMNILLAVDGSKNSEWAVDLVRKLPLAKEPNISVMHVVDLERLPGPQIPPLLAVHYRRVMREEMKSRLKAADQLTAKAASHLQKRWKKVFPVIVKGHPAERIIRMAKIKKADLVVLGSRGLRNLSAFLLGSVSQKVATYAPCSVLVVKKKIRGVKNVLLAVDGSSYSKKAVKFIKSSFLSKGIHVVILNIWSYPFVLPKLPIATIEKNDGKILTQAGFKVRPFSFTDHPAAGIVDFAKQKNVNLVVVGSRGITGLKQFYLGSVSHRVVKYSRSSVLVVRTR